MYKFNLSSLLVEAKEKGLGKKGVYVPFRDAFLAPGGCRTKIGATVNDNFCRSCNDILATKKKYKVSYGYLCSMCFYTSATYAEYEEISQKILEKLKNET